jgi:hypothetical protein
MNTTATRTDHEDLVALNWDYIKSVEQGDVPRFHEILADDFLCSNPDGSLVDKRQFLEQTARPPAIRDIRAHDVKVRIWETSPSSMPAPVIKRRLASSCLGAIRTSGCGEMGDGLPCRRM